MPPHTAPLDMLLTSRSSPQCKRIVTVRELARSQGFPDHFVFYAINDRVVTVSDAT